MFAHEFDGVRYDCGSKLGYLQANLQIALKHPEVGAEFRGYLRRLSCARRSRRRRELTRAQIDG